VRSIFAMEMCLQLDPTMQSQLRSLVLDDSAEMNYAQKWQRYANAANLLLQRPDLWHRGCWDYWDTEAKANEDFAMWVNGMLTREGSRTSPSGTADPYRGEPRYLTFTMAAVIVANTDCDIAISRICNIPEGALWMRATFAHILHGVRYLNFASIEKDTMYLIPGDPGWGLTPADLQAAKFEYLRNIV
jgi:hypothetical protein